MADHILVVGATGICGRAATEYFAGKGIRTTAISRRRPRDSYGADVMLLDLLDEAACRRQLAELKDVTQVIYTAVYEERRDIVSGWSATTHGDHNGAMLRNVVEAIDRASSDALRSIVLTHGSKSYGMHVRPAPLEAREDRDDARDVPNIFYFDQLDYITAKQVGRPWSWTAARIGLPIGFSSGGVLNTFSAIMAWATILHERGEPLHYPGGEAPGLLFAPLDTDILVRFYDWAGRTPAAANQNFNITNGELFSWRTSWPAIAEALGMSIGDYLPLSLAEEFQRAENIEAWDRARARHDLLAPDLAEFVGGAGQVVDFNMDRHMTIHKAPLITSQVKRHRAGFHDMIHNDEMFRKWVLRYRAERLIPPL